jgi:hypothetical protein
MSLAPDKLYDLLPAIHRIRDTEQGEPLRQLLAVITQQVDILEEDLEQLYDNQFIETCAAWVLPYIGDLIGYRSLHSINPDQVTPRAEVANTIGYRRRKGTASVLEQLARDVTGLAPEGSRWSARAVEFFQLLAWTQHMNHIRLTSFYAPDLRHWEPLERLGTAFETTAHTVDVRHIERGEGKYNILNVGIFFWRLNAFRLRNSPAVRVDDHRFLFSPLGANMPLFTRPQTERSITHLAEPINVPEQISRRVFDASPANYYGPGLSLEIEGFNLGDVSACNLSDADPAGTTWAHTPPTALVAIDPVLGRISFHDPHDEPPRVTFHYGFSAGMGGGEYERRQTFDAALSPVNTIASPGPIQPALDVRASGGVVELNDSGRFDETPSIELDPEARLEFRAANQHRPTLVVTAPLDITGGANAEVTLNGFLIAGAPIRILSVLGEALRKVRLIHCTLVPGLSLGIDGTPGTPGAPSLLVEQTESPIEVEIDHCILGAIHAPPSATVLIRHSVVDANSDTAVAYSDLDGIGAGGTVSVVNSTIIGTMRTELLRLASNSIFFSRTEDGTAPVRSERRQTGCVRFSWLPLEARVPRRYRCQPDLEIAEQIEAAIKKSGTGKISDSDRQAIQNAIVVWLVPAFTSLRYADPDYCQLRISAPEQIRTGADDEAEMGAFHDLFQPQRESNVRARMREYLRFGLEAGVFYET